VGTLAFGGFFTAVLAGRRDRWKEPYPAACQRAARWAFFVEIIGAFVAATHIDLGPMFFVFAGLACGGPALLPSARPVQADSVAAGKRPTLADRSRGADHSTSFSPATHQAIEKGGIMKSSDPGA